MPSEPSEANGAAASTRPAARGPRRGRLLAVAAAGVVLVVAGMALLAWNERRTAETAQVAEQVGRGLTEAKASPVAMALSGRLVHVVGTLAPAAPARDPAFGVTAPGLLRLRRSVEMYQWAERAESGGGARYDYIQVWSARALDSSRFHDPDGHRNPPMALHAATFDAADVTIGDYRLDPGLLHGLAGFTPLPALAGPNAIGGFRQVGDSLYHGADPGHPAIGDLRVRFSGVRSQVVTVVAGQVGDTLVPFQPASGRIIGFIRPGRLSAAAMLDAEPAGAATLVWALWAAGIALLALGGLVLAQPLPALALLAPSLALIALAVPWLTLRPWPAGVAVAAALIIALTLGFVRRRRLAAATSAESADAGSPEP